MELTHRGLVAIVTLTRAPVNAINDEMINAFHLVLDELNKQDGWSVLQIRSADKVFAAGTDLNLIRSWKMAPSPGSVFAAYIRRLQGLFHRVN